MPTTFIIIKLNKVYISMSKDIRSFFAVKCSPSTQKKLTGTTKEAEKKPGPRKRFATVIIDSDSDEEITSSVKRSKSLVAEKKANANKKSEDSKVPSKYFKIEKVSVSDVFGARPIKRDNTRNIVKKTVEKTDKEFHLDAEFESELANLDYVIPDILSKATNESHKNAVSPGKDPEETKEIWNSHKRESNNSEMNVNQGDYNRVQNKKVKLNIKTKSPKIEKQNKARNKTNESPLYSPHHNRNRSPLESPSLKKDVVLNSPAKISPLKYYGCVVKSPQLKKSPPSNILAINEKIVKSSKQLFKESVVSNDDVVLNPEGRVKELNIKTVSPMKVDTRSEKLPPTKKNCVIPVKQEVQEPSINLETKILSSGSSLWVEKYKPTTTKQIIGQQEGKSCVNKLTVWLKNWHKNQSGNKKLVKPSPWAKNDDGSYFKAALLSGPPGIGKTTTAHLVSKELGFDVVEFNASDTRSKKLLHQEVSELLSTNSLSPFFTGKGDQVTKQHVLLMDEVDGMAGNEDRGGVQELILLIKQSRIPIICMCNDRNHPKIRSLANYCFDLRFAKPKAEQIRGAMLSMCFKEKLKLKPDALTDIIKSANQDIRLIINHLSMLAIENTDLAKSTKYVKMGPWDIVRKIFSEEEHKSMSIHDKCDLFFHDYSVTPLFVQENYLNAVAHKPEGKCKIEKMELYASAARSLSLGDLTEKSIRSHNAWSLLPVQAVFSSLVPGTILEGHLGAQINFPAWFGKNSRQTKMNRLLQELTVHSRLKISGNKEAMNLDYVTPLEESILSPLVKFGVDGIPEAISVLSEYCLVREDLESLSELSSWPNTRNRFSEVESKVKAAFTRAYNKTCTPTPYATVPIKKGSKTDIDQTNSIPEEEDVIQEDDDEEEDGLEVDAMIVVKKKTASKRTEKESAPSTSKGTQNSKRGRKK